MTPNKKTDYSDVQMYATILSSTIVVMEIRRFLMIFNTLIFR